MPWELGHAAVDPHGVRPRRVNVKVALADTTPTELVCPSAAGRRLGRQRKLGLHRVRERRRIVDVHWTPEFTRRLSDARIGGVDETSTGRERLEGHDAERLDSAGHDGDARRR